MMHLHHLAIEINESRSEATSQFVKLFDHKVPMTSSAMFEERCVTAPEVASSMQSHAGQ